MAQNSPVRGQIMLIRLQNFMTYDFIELRPGFNLNFIIGPNGTGKSSFVCAVMLVFGAKLKSVGRADSIKSFVKNGCNEATIEIELFEPFGQNIAICRKIDLEGNSQYLINGKTANSGKIAEVRKIYNISLDNLCSFLPQEKVQDFSKLTPQQLLEQTQRAAGTEEMTNDYIHLKELLTEMRNRLVHNSGLTEEIDELKQKNARIKDKVMAYVENKALCEKETLLKQKRAWLLYSQILDELKEIDDLENITKQEYEGIEKEYDRTSRTVDHLQQYSVVTSRRLKEILKQREQIIVKYRDKVKILRDSINRFEALDNVAQSRLFEEDKKKVELKQHQETLDKLMNDLHTFVKKNGTDEDLKAKEKEVNSDIESNQKEESEMMEKKVGIEDELEQLKIDIKNTSLEYRLLERRRNFRLEYLRRYEPDVYKSVEWLKEHRRMFQGRVFNPMLLELDITDVKYAKYIEARVAFRDLISFTCTNPHDLNLLIQKLRTEQGLRVNVICSEESDKRQYYPEIPLDKIRAFGFNIYMKDFLIGPIEIIRYLCKVYKIHTIPVGDESVSKRCDKVPLPIQLFFSENHMFSVKVSVYSGEKSITVKQLNEPKIFSVLLNNRKIKEIIERERELIHQSGEKETKLKLAKHFLKSLNDRQDELRQAKRNIVTLIAEKDHIANKVKRAEIKITELEKNIRSPESIKRELQKEREELKTKINQCLTEIRTHVSELQELRIPPNEEELRRDVISFSLDKALKMKGNVVQTVDKCKKTLEVYHRRRMMKKIQCSTLKHEAMTLTSGVSPGEKQFELYEEAFMTVKDSIAELDEDLAQIKFISEFIGGGDAELKTEYDDRQDKIDDLTDLLEDSKVELGRLTREFENLRTKWLVPIHELVSKVNELYGNFFEAMGCVGEVRLTTGPDKDEFDKYGIEIRVKFRDGVPLHPLGRHFQSGGERAVATAVYLLSLQELAHVPFRFVDEINQGMDPVNEKRIVDLMVKVTDQKNSVQYFFITPKLLPDVQCSETMIVHCIYGGPVLFASQLWDLDSYLNLA